MKEIIVILSFIAILTASQCTGSSGKEQSADLYASDTGKAELAFREYEHHFGKVEKGEKISWQFTYENKGTGNLIIKAVTTTCGCTVPRYDKKPVPPGGKGSIEVIFDTSDRNGMQTKVISVMSNAKVPVTLLKITAEVEQK